MTLHKKKVPLHDIEIQRVVLLISLFKILFIKMVPLANLIKECHRS